MTEVIESGKSGVIVIVDRETHEGALQILKELQRTDPTITIGAVYGGYVTEGVQEGLNRRKAIELPSPQQISHSSH